MSRFLIASTGHSLPLSGGLTTVGIDPACTVPVRADLGLHPRHFDIAPSVGGWQLIAAPNAPVFLNGEPVHAQMLRDGDHIQAGRLALTYRDENFAETQVAAAVPLTSIEPLSPPQPPNRHPAPTSAAKPLTKSRPSPDDIKTNAREALNRLLIALSGPVLIFLGCLGIYGAFFEPHPPLKPEELVTVDCQIKRVTEHRISRSSSWFELETYPPSRLPIHMPDGLRASPDWMFPESTATLGFEKRDYESTIPGNFSGEGYFSLITIEVNGKPRRKLSMHNAEILGTTEMFVVVGPAMLLIGLWIFYDRCQTWWARRKGLR